MGNMQRSLDKRPGNSSIPKRRREAKLCLRRQRSVPALRSLPLAYHLSKKQRPKSHKLTEKARRRIRLIVKPKKEISSSDLSQRLSSYVTICKRACPIDDTPMESGWEAKKKLKVKGPKISTANFLELRSQNGEEKKVFTIFDDDKLMWSEPGQSQVSRMFHQDNDIESTGSDVDRGISKQFRSLTGALKKLNPMRGQAIGDYALNSKEPEMERKMSTSL